MTQTIAAVLFDVGGVLVELDGAPSLIRWLGPTASREALHRRWLESPAVIAHETGRIDLEEFAARAVVELGLPVSAAEFRADFLSWPRGMQPGALALLDEVRGRCRVAALSNTCAAHWPAIAAMGLAGRFDRLFLSHEVGHLKPSDAAFLAALDGLALRPEQVLFIDDNGFNVDAAAALGLLARCACDAHEARDVLREFGLVTGRIKVQPRTISNGNASSSNRLVAAKAKPLRP